VVETSHRKRTGYLIAVKKAIFQEGKETREQQGQCQLEKNRIDCMTRFRLREADQASSYASHRARMRTCTPRNKDLLLAGSWRIVGTESLRIPQTDGPVWVRH
jgi:hypothetical protein